MRGDIFLSPDIEIYLVVWRAVHESDSCQRLRTIHAAVNLAANQMLPIWLHADDPEGHCTWPPVDGDRIG